MHAPETKLATISGFLEALTPEPCRAAAPHGQKRKFARLDFPRVSCSSNSKSINDLAFGASLVAVRSVQCRQRGHTARRSAAKSWQPEVLGVPLTPDFLAVGLCYFAQGALGLAALAKPFLLKDEMHLPPAEATQLLTLTYWPWFLKPLWGFIADALPIFGSRRRAYLLLAGLISALGWYGLGTGLANNATEATLALMMLGNLGIAVSDVVVDALVVEKARQDDTLMGNLQSYSWSCRGVGAVLSAYFSGALLESWGVQSIFSLTALLPLLVAVSASLIQEEQIADCDRQPSAEDGRNQLQELWDTIRKPEVYLPLTFIVCWQATPNSGSAMFYFMTNDLHFSAEFLGRAQLTTAIATLAGTVLYNRVFASVPVRQYLFWVNVTAVALGLLPLLLITRVNLMLNIPDQAFVIGDDAIQTVAGELAHMPILVLAARICPPGLEATLFAFVMSVLNLSSSLSGLIGSALTDYLHVTESDFSNLAALTLICNLSGLLPLVLLGLVPEAAVENEAIQKNDEE